MSKKTGLQKLINEMMLANIPAWETECRFHHRRLWRFDICWKSAGVAVEFQGGVWTPDQRAHIRASNYVNDRHKINEAQLLGWIVLEFTADMVRDGTAIRQIKQALELEP